MPRNPFYVHPGTDFGPGLMGLAQTIGKVGEIKKAEEKEQEEIDRIAAMKKGALEAFQSGDPDKIRQFMIQNPEMATSLNESINLNIPTESANAYKNALFSAAVDFSKAPQLLQDLRSQFAQDGIDPQEQTKLDDFEALLESDPAAAQKNVEAELALLADENTWKRYKDIKGEPTKKTEKIKNFEYYQKLLKDDPLGAATFSKVTGSAYSPSPLKKLIGERQMLIDEGEPLDSDIIKAYDSKITGQDINIKEMTQDEIDTWGAWVNLSGKVPSVGRGKQATKVRIAILKSAAQQALGSKGFGEEDTEPDKTPAQAALDVIGSQADTRAIQGSLNFLEKQLSSMGSFVTNIDMQIDKVSELSKDLMTFNIRLLNTPLRLIRGRILGSPLQAKYDLYLTEIENEIGKLATGSSASIAELSATAQEKWDKIHDKSLSVKDMLSLLEETRDAARMRKKSVEIQLELSRSKMRRRGVIESPTTTILTPTAERTAKDMTTEELMSIIKGTQ